jgi:signal transduction histidine kinase
MFLRFNNKKDKEINSITKYIEEINKKNYQLNIDDISEDELSILKNEIYKVTIMLKEDAENSKKEKIELKESLSNISHQLKTPLTSILIILDNLIDNPDMDKDTREDFIRDIKREITNITFLVQSILKLSKLDTNTVDFIEDDIPIDEIINEVIKNLSMLCDLKNIKIITKLDNINLKCDFKWQVEAITNIVKNSLEHSLENSSILITAKHNKVYANITIKDNGTGIAKEDLPHIFERFYKSKNAKNDSIGIGLALAKSIIEKDNGTISVDSNKCGTEFTIKYFTKN